MALNSEGNQQPRSGVKIAVPSHQPNNNLIHILTIPTAFPQNNPPLYSTQTPKMATANSNNAYVLGVGMTQFLKPRRTREYPELGYEAGVKAMIDAQINYDDVQTGIACYCYGDSTSGQRIFYQFGMTGIPIYNTNNACATGSTGLHLARTMVKGGTADCVLVVGFEQMRPGSIKSVWDDRPSAHGPSTRLMEEVYGKDPAPRNAQYFGNAGREYMTK